MKKIIIIIGFLIGSYINVNAQAPEGINYQATVRDANGALMTNQNANVIFTVHESTMTGTVVYSETQTVTTNNYGGFNSVIGAGAATMGTFSTINWGANPHYLNVNVNGNDLGTFQLMSVPYALNAKTAKSLETPIWRERAFNGDFYTVGQPLIIGDSISNATMLTIRDTTFGTETIDIIRTNMSTGNDIININARGNTSSAEFIEARMNNDLEFVVRTNGTMDIDSNITIDNGEYRRTQTGDANLVPIAYGEVFGNGNIRISSSTSNFTINKTGTGTYQIQINGLSSHSNAVTVVNTYGTTPRLSTYTPLTTYVRVRTFNTSGSLQDSDFNFVIYQK